MWGRSRRRSTLSPKTDPLRVQQTCAARPGRFTKGSLPSWKAIPPAVDACKLPAPSIARGLKEKTMNRTLIILAAGACVIAGLATPARAAPDMALTRLDCGTPQAPTPVNQRFSDTYAYGDLKLQFVFSCYLIKHDGDYLLWDTGHAMTAPNVAPKVSIVDQLA